MKDEHKGGRQHLYTPKELDQKLTEYLDKCQDEGRRPTRPGMRLALNMSEDTLSRYEKGEGGYKAFAEPIKKAMDRIRDELEQGRDTMNIFLLKQPCYGGYTDKPSGDSGTLNVNITFGGGDSGSFGK